MSTDRDAGDLELDTVCGTPEIPTSDEPLQSLDHHQTHEKELDPVLLWVPSGRRLISGLVGLNVVLLGTALVVGENFNPECLSHQEPEVFLLVLMGISLIWMFWYLLWARRHPDISPHRDHHAGGVPVILALLLFAAFSLLLFVFRVGYLMSTRECKPAATLISPFMEAPFLTLQTYLLWAHSKDCIHRHKIITRSGLMMILSTDLLLWLNAVTEDSIHVEIELGKQNGLADDDTIPPGRDNSDLAGSYCSYSTFTQDPKQMKKKAQENKKKDISLLEAKISAPPTVQEQGATKPWAKRVRQEICAFLILSNIMLWLIPAFGVHPQFENGLGKEFFGFTAWFIMMNLGQPLGVFYRMHSVAALTELLISA
ncbi:proton channel OTOP3-like [Neolamprologus brichardi]|uniref:proton channel OTOP3-like n=1 Tax=Neolamprologus brichardi TaxID=32507 RepID=UPI0016437CA5|nr:proton channel OTOP3-like [Neolamprologus brichardi]